MREADDFATFMCRMSWKSGSLNLLEPSGPTGPVTELLYLYLFYYFWYLANETCTLVLALVTAEMELDTSRIPVSHFITLPDVLSYSDFKECRIKVMSLGRF